MCILHTKLHFTLQYILVVINVTHKNLSYYVVFYVSL